MNKKYYSYLLLLLPIMFITINIACIILTDKKLVYKDYSIKYREINYLLKDVGIQKYMTSGGTCITFETPDNIIFERRYLGIGQMILAHFHYNDLIKARKQRIGLYFNPDDNQEKKIPFVSLGRSDKKDLWYYLDIYAYVQKSYSAIFLISYILIFCLLLQISINKRLVKGQKNIWILAIALPILYMII